MSNMALPESTKCPKKHVQFPPDCWFDEACILDMDYFVKTISGIKAKGVRPELIGSIITHYASQFLIDLLSPGDNVSSKRMMTNNIPESPESATSAWLKKRLFIETLVGILPPEKDSIPCDFLLRLLRVGNMVNLENAHQTELEKRISCQLDQASLEELMIPSFSHTCGTLLDVELAIRLVRRFVNLDEAVKSGGAVVKVAKLADNYLAEAALDGNLCLDEFVDLAIALPSHARAADDGLYRAIDTYLKVHPGMSKKERKSLCKLIDCALMRLRMNDYHGRRSPTTGLELPGRCYSNRQVNAQQLEIKRLKEDVPQCVNMQGQIERLTQKKRGVLGWKKIGNVEGDSEIEYGKQTPMDVIARIVKGRTPNRWTNSMS
ncbi:hypothetical protein LIER_03126 [Lithospermum erythrorhizon]|uniref:NPH3 domain-containing protein n=1 Tax=Lithospermum erythrorhizon TaxID=34254 RepID=A0AAV3NTQ3_LITER